jgi:flagellar biosynthetic protein FliQ
MDAQIATHILAEALMTAFWICAPLLAISFVLGLAINIIQIATSLQDPSFSTVPRLAACLVAILALMPWMLGHATSFTLRVFGNLARYAR